MKLQDKIHTNWTICSACKGRGKKNRGVSKKAQQQYQTALRQFEENNHLGIAPEHPKGTLHTCVSCSGSGLQRSEIPTKADTTNLPTVAIIGAGIGGVALAVACLHRGIPFLLFERDANFESRSQGYGLTLQQASKALKSFGITTLKDGITSTKHVVHTTDGKIIGEWGLRKWLPSEKKENSKHSNVHIARQALRLVLLEQLGGIENVKWGHQLIHLDTSENNTIRFDVNGKIKNYTVDLIVGTDGIRSTVRKLLLGDSITPLRYLNCIVILGICSLDALKNRSNSLLDSETVFQTANGFERIYMMPYSSTKIMWQFSFPISEAEAIKLSKKGAKALKEEACRRTQWHSPIPEIMQATQETEISGYPVYDRALLTTESLEKSNSVTLLGDAAHPMSPFKGQGANQALLDALSLARFIKKAESYWKNTGIRKSILTDFENEMLARSAVKVKDSKAAAEFLHSEMVLHESNEPRKHQ